MKKFMSLIDWLFGTHPKEYEVIKPTRPKSRPRHAIKVWRYCRAGKKGGRKLYCPKCNEAHKISYMDWDTKECRSCGTKTDKYNWYTVPTGEEVTRLAEGRPANHV